MSANEWRQLSPPSVSRIELDHYDVALPQVLSDSTHGSIASFGLNTARITAEDGQAGLGYSYMVGNIGGSAVHSLLRDDLAPFLLGRTGRTISETWLDMWWHAHFVGRGGLLSFALATLDVALWDLMGKAADLPWHRLLGGERRPVAAYAGGIDLQFTLDALLRQTDDFLEQGFQAIKMKVGRPDLAEDVQRVAAMRRRLGTDFPLMADANMQWSPDEAVRAARALSEYDLVWLEEPVVPDAYAAHARIAEEGGLPIATGENLHSTHEFELMLDLGRVAYPEPDLVTLGGVTPFLEVAESCQRRGLPVTTHGVHDLHVQLLAALPNASFLEVHGFGLERFMPEPLVFSEGSMAPRDGTGHGVTLDREALSPFLKSSAQVGD